MLVTNYTIKCVPCKSERKRWVQVFVRVHSVDQSKY
jgi:hypothetical protein